MMSRIVLAPLYGAFLCIGGEGMAKEEREVLINLLEDVLKNFR